MPHGSVFFIERQRISPYISLPLVLFFVGLSVYMVTVQLIGGEPVGDNPASDLGLVLIVLLTGMLLPGFLIGMRMTTMVDQDAVWVWFLPIKKRSIPLSELESYRQKRFNWLKDYGGFGVRRGRDGWAYIMKGDTGIELQRIGGRRILVGTQKPDEFLQALRMLTGLSDSTEHV